MGLARTPDLGAAVFKLSARRNWQGEGWFRRPYCPRETVNDVPCNPRSRVDSGASR
jgi:hypothetical protein